MSSEREEQIMAIVRKIKNYFDKFYVVGSGTLWLAATIWDIYKLQRYWYDYALEIYSSILITFTIFYSICPNSYPKYLYKNFQFITNFQGRAILQLLISFLFLKDKHAFHKLCAYLFLIGGIMFFFCEILVPTTKEERKKIAEKYKDNEKNVTVPKNVSIERSTHNIKQVSNNIEEINNNKVMGTIKEEIEDKNIGEQSDEKKIKALEEKIDAENEKPAVINAYDLPDDF